MFQNHHLSSRRTTPLGGAAAENKVIEEVEAALEGHAAVRKGEEYEEEEVKVGDSDQEYEEIEVDS